MNSKAKKDTKDRCVILRVTTEEYSLMKMYAHMEGSGNLSDYIRSKILKRGDECKESKSNARAQGL